MLSLLSLLSLSLSLPSLLLLSLPDFGIEGYFP
jgi:hypothetical protein